MSQEGLYVIGLGLALIVIVGLFSSNKADTPEEKKLEADREFIRQEVAKQLAEHEKSSHYNGGDYD